MATTLHTVVETQRFIRDAEMAGVTDDERAAMVDAIALDPAQGDEVQGSGAFARFAWRDGAEARAAAIA